MKKTYQSPKTEQIIIVTPQLLNGSSGRDTTGGANYGGDGGVPGGGTAAPGFVEDWFFEEEE